MIRYIPLVQVCDFQGGSQPPKDQWIDHEKEGYVRMLQIRDFTQPDKNNVEFVRISNTIKTCNEDDILIGRYGASVGKILTGLAGAYNVAIIKTIPDTSRLSKRFLYYYLNSPYFQNFILSVGSRAAQAGFNKDDLSDAQIPSLPLEDQSSIVTQLDKVSELLEFRKGQLSKLDELVKSRFIEMFGNAENKIPIGELCNVTGGYSFKSGDISNDGAIKILQIGNVYLDNVSWETTNYLPEGYDEKYSRFMLNEGDIVVALTRPIIQSLGNVKACIVKSRDLPCLLNQRVGRITVKEGKNIFLEFIYSCLMTDDFTKYVESCSIGCSQPNISTKDIENYLIPNAPYEEQKLFAEFKKQTEKLKSEIKESLEKLETLKKSLMQKYFG